MDIIPKHVIRNGHFAINATQFGNEYDVQRLTIKDNLRDIVS